MAKSLNKVQLIGTLGRDPDVRFLPNGNPVASLSLATDESYTDRQTGQKVEQTEWHRITVFGKLAEICQQYLFKGSKAYFEGRLKTNEWEKDGIKRYTTEIVASDLILLTPRQQQTSQAPQQAQYQPAQYQQATQAPQPATPQQGNQATQYPPAAYGKQPPQQSQPQQASPSPYPETFNDEIPF